MFDNVSPDFSHTFPCDSAQMNSLKVNRKLNKDSRDSTPLYVLKGSVMEPPGTEQSKSEELAPRDAD